MSHDADAQRFWEFVMETDQRIQEWPASLRQEFQRTTGRWARLGTANPEEKPRISAKEVAKNKG